MAEPRVVSDLTQVPRFDAVDTWMTKLKAWCEDAVEELDERLSAADEEELRERVESLTQENSDLEFRAAEFDTLVELFFDMRRGIRELGEIENWLKGKGFEA